MYSLMGSHNKQATIENDLDIYGTRLGKGQLAKDPIVFQQEGPANITVANHRDHARIRKLLSHAFSETALREQEPILTQYFDLLLSRLKEHLGGPTDGKVDIMSWYNFTTFDIIGNMFQSIKFLGVMRFVAHYPAINRVFKTILWAFPSIAEKRQSHFDFTRNKTESRLDQDNHPRDFLSYILRYNDERGMMREEIISTSGVLLIGGSETTATLLSGATYHLLTNPHTLRRLCAEVRAAFKAEAEITLPSLSNPESLPYLEAVLTESLRVYPPVAANLPRMTGSQGDVIDGYHVPAKVSVGVHQWAASQSKDNFIDPASFIPERWLQEAPEQYRQDKKAALQPFSTGPRSCLGKK
ncbi:MAG: hypothetical protein Q9170_007347 [Blastenia crenularia]